MQLEATRLRNFGPFVDFSVDMRDFDGKQLIAVCGKNGDGKSTFLELGFPGALYRDTPTQGALTERATDRKSILESRFVSTSGKVYTFRHLVDAVSGKSEAVVLDESGVPVVSSSKVRDFDAWVEKNLTSPAVLYSSVFGFQNGGGFLAAKPTERKAILLRVLGIEHLEALAKDASENASRAELELKVALEKLVEAEGLGQVDAAWAEVEALTEEVSKSEARVAKAESDLAAYRALSADAALAKARYAEVQSQKMAIEAKLAAERSALALLEERIRNNRGVLGNAVAIRSAVEETARLSAQITTNSESLAEARKAKELAGQRVESLRLALVSAQARLSRAEAALSGADVTKELASRLEAAQEAHDAAVAEHAAAKSELEALKGTRLAGADQRIAVLRGALENIVAEPERAKAIALMVLDADDMVAAEAAAYPEKLREITERVADLAGKVALAEKPFHDSRNAKNEIPRLELAEVEHAAATEAVSKATAEHAEAKAACPSESLLAGLLEVGATFSARVAELAPLVKVAPNLDTAEARLAELEPKAEQDRARIADLEVELAALPVVPAPGEEADEVPLVDSLAAWKENLSSFTAQLGAAKERLTKAQEWAGKVPALRESYEAVRLELSDWKVLAQDLGKNGLQAAEIDAAGPELNVLVNDLLHSCIGTRWTVSIETTKLSSDGKKVLEGCEVMVIDTHAGQVKEGSRFSGGEKVIIGEALSLAFSMLQCRRAGLREFTLVRDESGAALDAGMARAYVAMLRRAATLIDAKHVLLVTHSEEVKELCDARINVCPTSEKKVEFLNVAA